MRSKIISFRIPFGMHEEISRLSKELGFRNLSRFMFAGCLIAIQDARRKVWVKQIANANPKLQDYTVGHILRWPLDLKEMAKLMHRIDKNRIR